MPMRRRRGNGRRPRRTGFKNSRANRTKRLVDGHDKTPTWQKIINAGAPIVSAIPAIAKGLSTVVSLVNSEKNYFDVSQPTVNVDVSNPMWVCLTNIPQGDDIANRTGRSILLQNVQVRLQYYSLANSNAAGAPFYETMRVTVYCDKDYDASLGETFATIQAKIFADPANPMTTPVNRNWSDRFVIMKDKVYEFTQSNARKMFRLFTKLQIHVKYFGPNATDLANNQIFFMLQSENPGNVAQSNAALFTRVSYTDN